LSPLARLLLGVLAATALCASQSGCRWHQWFGRSAVEPPPIAFSALPGPAEAVAAVNANTQRVQSLQAQGATISIPGAPSIGAELIVERPQRLRLRAGTQILGPELDLGSNEQLFWLWAARMPSPSVYFARHDQFAASRARQMLVIEPAWLIDALGLVEIDPAAITEGPIVAGNERIQLRTTLGGAGNGYTRLLVLHSKYAWILEQHVYDERGQIVASARNSGHEYHPVDGVSLPKRVEVQVPQGLLRFQLDVDRWAINPALGGLAEGAAVFELPRAALGNYPFVDLSDPNFVPPISSATPSTHVSQAPADSYRQRLRGLR
jgi:hypothetical protein